MSKALSPAMPTPPKPSARNPRRAFALVAIAASGLLLLTSWQSRETAYALAETVTRGQGENFMSDLSNRASSRRGPPSLQAMTDSLAAGAAEGLLAIALVTPDGRVQQVAGSLRAEPFVQLELGDRSSVRRLGERVRFTPPAPPHRAGMYGGQAPSLAPPYDPPPPFPGFAPPGVPAPGFDGPQRGPPPRVVLEFIPTRAQDLLGQSDRTLAVAIVSACALLLATAFLWRRSVRAEDEDRRSARGERLAALGTMSAVIAHEIRNPLASLKGHAQLLVEKLGTDTRERQQADRVVAGAVRLERLTRDLLDFVRDGPLATESIDARELLDRAVLDCSGDVGIEAGGGDALPCRIDPTRVRLALVNLIENALQADPTGVVASVHRDGACIEFVVRDRGPGVAPAELERIFEPFVTGRTRGAGLGLALVRRVAEQHGGVAWARNLAPEPGAEFGLRVKAG